MLIFFYNYPIVSLILAFTLAFVSCRYLLKISTKIDPMIALLSCIVIWLAPATIIQKSIEDSIKGKITTLQFLLDENKVPLSDQMAFAYSPINEARVVLGKNKNTHSSVLTLLRGDSRTEVRDNAYFNLQKRNELPMATFEDYKKTNDPTYFYAALGVLAFSALVLFFFGRKGKMVETSRVMMAAYLATPPAMLFSFLIPLSIADNFNEYRSEVLREKIQNKTLSQKELIVVLEDLSHKDTNVINRNAEKLSNEQVSLVYNEISRRLSGGHFLAIEKEMKKRNLITEHKLTPGDLE